MRQRLSSRTVSLSCLNGCGNSKLQSRPRQLPNSSNTNSCDKCTITSLESVELRWPHLLVCSRHEVIWSPDPIRTSTHQCLRCCKTSASWFTRVLTQKIFHKHRTASSLATQFHVVTPKLKRH